MNDSLFGPAAEAVKAAFSDPLNPPARGGDCPDWLAMFLGALGLGFVCTIVVEALLRVIAGHA